MSELDLLDFDIINAKFGYILACLSSYSSLDLSKRLSKIDSKIALMRKSLNDNKEYVDIRDVIELRNDLKELEIRLPNDDNVSLKGHKIACLFFELSLLVKKMIYRIENPDFIEYLELTSKYLYDCGRIVNIEILCFEDK